MPETPPREAAVAGLFYPEEPAELRAQIEALLHGGDVPGAATGPAPKALVVPHAGYIYSGATAAAAYRRLRPAAEHLSRVVLLGPAHRVPVAGLALPEASAFLTPLGAVPVDAEAAARVRGLPGVAVSALAHAYEHSLEVQLPFLQVVLGAFRVLPLVVGEARPDEVAAALEAVWGGSETLIVVSTDLSHYHEYERARELDAATCAAILERRDRLAGDQACGCRPLNGLLRLAAARGYELELLDYRNSGDTAGSRERVVGYGAFALHEA